MQSIDMSFLVDEKHETPVVRQQTSQQLREHHTARLDLLQSTRNAAAGDLADLILDLVNGHESKLHVLQKLLPELKRTFDRASTMPDVPDTAEQEALRA